MKRVLPRWDASAFCTSGFRASGNCDGVGERKRRKKRTAKRDGENEVARYGGVGRGG